MRSTRVAVTMAGHPTTTVKPTIKRKTQMPELFRAAIVVADE